MDKDLVSIQEARDLAEKALEAQQIWANANQEEVDRVCASMAEVAFNASERLGRLAAEETGFGVSAHKRIKNEFASKYVWESIKDIKTVGVVRHDPVRKINEIAYPMGVVAALIPSTNPTSTIMAKTLTSVKARDAVVHAPHPSAYHSSYEAAQIMARAAERAGAPPGLVSCMQNISLSGTQELMGHKNVSLILATGGGPMVRAAHSAGKPAYGVGPGNVPVYVDKTADIEKAARYIVSSKAFDYSTICATEQAVVADNPISHRLSETMISQGAFFINEIQADALRNTLFFADGSINPATVGKSPQHLAGMAGFQVPDFARILVARLNRVGKEEPLSREKMTTVLGWYDVEGWEEGCERSIELIQFGGRGHTQIIFASDEDVILSFGLEKPVFRILVNTMGTLGAIGFTTGLMPSMTLGAGGLGGSITGDNITVTHLMNIKRLAYETTPPPDSILQPGNAYPSASKLETPSHSTQEIESIVRDIINDILKA